MIVLVGKQTDGWQKDTKEPCEPETSPLSVMMWMEGGRRGRRGYSGRARAEFSLQDGGEANENWPLSQARQPAHVQTGGREEEEG